MTTDYEKPEFVEIKMDAEIGGYQTDDLEETVVPAERSTAED